MPQINLDKQSERWRYRCPLGHTQWQAVNGRFYCNACANSDADRAEPEFDQLHDEKTGDTHTRAEVDFVAEERRHYKAEYAVEVIGEEPV